MLNGYNRNATIVGNEFAWVGATCVASWGYSSTCFNGNCSFKLPWREGPDARGGEQPRGTRVLNNLFREMGIFQKQASAYFHAKSGLSEIAGNGAHSSEPALTLNDADESSGCQWCSTARVPCSTSTTTCSEGTTCTPTCSPMQCASPAITPPSTAVSPVPLLSTADG